MKEIIPFIAVHSPHLAIALGRLIRDTSAKSGNEGVSRWLGCDEAFELAHACGGFTELDFRRPDDQSVNPRPARIALIVLAELREISDMAIVCRALQGGILATIPFAEMETLSAPPHVDSHIDSLASTITREAHAILEAPGSISGATSPISRQVAAALILDRARHRHLFATERAASWDEFVRTVSRVERDTAQAAPITARLLQAWIMRAARRRLPDHPSDHLHQAPHGSR